MRAKTIHCTMKDSPTIKAFRRSLNGRVNKRERIRVSVNIQINGYPFQIPIIVNEITGHKGRNEGDAHIKGTIPGGFNFEDVTYNYVQAVCTTNRTYNAGIIYLSNEPL